MGKTKAQRLPTVLPGVPLERGLNLIYVDDSGLTLTWGIVVPEEPTPIHSHGTWGVVAVFRGRDRYQIWTRDDHSEGAGPAIVRFINERILETGDVITEAI